MTKYNPTQNIRRSLKLSVLALVAGSALWLSGCQPQSGASFSDGEAAIRAALPQNAQNIQILGNGWATFELDGRKFMFRRTTWERSATDCITVLPNTKITNSGA